MYPDALVQNATLPAVVYYVTSTDREDHLQGMSKLAHARFTIECYALTRTTASAIARAIRDTGIDAFRGVVSSHTFCGIKFDADQYMQEPPTDGNQEHRYIVSFDMLVHYKEP
jgi:hypothetical protein